MPYVDATIGDYQYGYCGERSTADQIFTVRQILEKVVNMVRTNITQIGKVI